MNFSREVWDEKRKTGMFRYLLVDGILLAGGPFAVVMQIVGVLILRDEGQTIGQYFTSTMTWVTFILHGVLFGLIFGYVSWRRGENAYRTSAPGKK